MASLVDNSAQFIAVGHREEWWNWFIVFATDLLAEGDLKLDYGVP